MFRKKPQITDELVNQVLAITAQILHAQGIHRKPDLDASLAEEGLGLDSMGRLELLQAIEQELHVRIPEHYWDTKKFKNLRDLIRVIARQEL